jgi:hypothetical protein
MQCEASDYSHRNICIEIFVFPAWCGPFMMNATFCDGHTRTIELPIVRPKLDLEMMMLFDMNPYKMPLWRAAEPTGLDNNSMWIPVWPDPLNPEPGDWLEGAFEATGFIQKENNITHPWFCITGISRLVAHHRTMVDLMQGSIEDHVRLFSKQFAIGDCLQLASANFVEPCTFCEPHKTHEPGSGVPPSTSDNRSDPQQEWAIERGSETTVRTGCRCSIGNIHGHPGQDLAWQC